MCNFSVLRAFKPCAKVIKKQQSTIALTRIIDFYQENISKILYIQEKFCQFKALL